MYMQMQLELRKFDISLMTVNVEVHRPSVDGWKSPYPVHWSNSAPHIT